MLGHCISLLGGCVIGWAVGWYLNRATNYGNSSFTNNYSSITGYLNRATNNGNSSITPNNYSSITNNGNSSITNNYSNRLHRTHSEAHEIPFEPLRCSDAAGRSWLLAYQNVHRQMLEGERDLLVSINIFSTIFGLGDLVRGLLVTTFISALTGRMTLYDWAIQAGNDTLNPLLNAFEPGTILWNRTEHHPMHHPSYFLWKFLRGRPQSSTDFLKHLVPVGISPAVVKSERLYKVVAKVDEKLRERLAMSTDNFDIRARHEIWKWGMVINDTTEIVALTTNELPSLDHFIGVIEATACCSSDDRDRFVADRDVSLIRETCAKQSLLQIMQCSVRMLFNSLAPALRGTLSDRLAAVAELYRSQALKLDAWPQRSAAHHAERSEDEHNDCNGLTLTQCLRAQLGIQTRPLIGIHYRVGDQVFEHQNENDKRNTRWNVNRAVACGRNLAASLGFVHPVFLLITDDEALKNAIRNAHSKNQDAVLFDTGTGMVVEEVQVGEVDERPEKTVDVAEVNVSDIIVPNSPPSIHIVRSEMSNKASVTVDLFAEVLTLATTDALVLTQSNFGRLAWLFGGHPPNRVAAFNWGTMLECVLDIHPDEIFWRRDSARRPRRGVESL